MYFIHDYSMCVVFPSDNVMRLIEMGVFEDVMKYYRYETERYRDNTVCIKFKRNQDEKDVKANITLIRNAFAMATNMIEGD